MSSDEAIFLSAGVPDPNAKHFVAAAEPAAIAAAVSALLFVILGRRRLVWGGQPAITPMVWAYAQSMEVDYEAWVTLYQSNRFENDFPEETRRFENVIFTERVSEDIAPNLALMRRRMLRENKFSAAVFIGGMGGILDEHQMFLEYAPKALIIPVASTGGAAAVLAHDIHADPALFTSLDYVELFLARLGVHPGERRFRTPKDQPERLVDRIEQPREARR